MSSDSEAVTTIGVIEDPQKCPSEFIVIYKTIDDADAELWKDTAFFAAKKARYLCFSKKEHIADFVVEDILIINERDMPPEGYSPIQKTMDTDQRAWRKKQVCYKLSRKSITEAYVIDIVLHRLNGTFPDGYKSIGEINGGISLCFKLSNSGGSSSIYPSVIRNTNPFSVAQQNHMDYSPTGLMPGRFSNHAYMNGTVTTNGDINMEEFELRARASSDMGLQLNFALNPRIRWEEPFVNLSNYEIPPIEEFLAKYNYDFSLEKRVLREFPKKDEP